MRPLAALALLACAPLLGGWTPLANCWGDDTAWRSGVPHTTWHYSTAYPSGDFSEAETLQIIEDSFEEWGAPGCSNFVPAQGPNTNADPMGWTQDGTVGFYESWWPPSLGSSTLAVTFPSWTSSCDMASASMVVNGAYYQWVAGSWGNDLQSVVTHEVGHWVGLDHSWYADATMTASYNGGIGDRILSCDDTDAACTLYPSGGTACSEDDYCACGTPCVNGWCDGVVSGDPLGDDDDDVGPDDDAGPDDDDVVSGGCSGPNESYTESEPNDWANDGEYDAISSGGGDVLISSTISCGNNGNAWTGDIDWFVVEFPCADTGYFSVDWSGGTSDLDFWVYDENADPLVANTDEDYAGPVTETAFAANKVYFAVACWGGPTVSYSVEIDWAPAGNPPGGDDDDAVDDDDSTPWPDDDDATPPPQTDDDDAAPQPNDDDAAPQPNDDDEEVADEADVVLAEGDRTDLGTFEQSCACAAGSGGGGWSVGLLLLGMLRIRSSRRPH